MNQQKSLVRISELLSRFQVQVGILNANAQLDINIVAQDVLIPIFKEVFNSPNLFNADHGLAQSFPAVDLIDLQAKISFQITSTAKSGKIEETLRKIVIHHPDKFDWKHYIFIITQKLNNYTSKMIEKATENKFAFDKTHILDLKDLFELISALPYEKIRIIENYLETQFSDEKSGIKINNYGKIGQQNINSEVKNDNVTFNI
ncbi:MAG: hypothetical protein EAZ97_13200 [Bacteroidetes bacterium]|nr:MAG: hypothetical protein EAZ97_13200 [Bacteroidota bacterium]